MTESSLFTRLREAFLTEAATVARYLYFVQVAEIEGHVEAARLFAEAAESSACVAHGHLDFLQYVGDPTTDQPIGETQLNVASAVTGELTGAVELYPDLIADAHAEGLADVASWLMTVQALKNAHVGRFEQVLSELTGDTADVGAAPVRSDRE